MANAPLEQGDSDNGTGLSGWLGLRKRDEAAGGSTATLPGSGAASSAPGISTGGVSGGAPANAPGSNTGWVNLQDYAAADKGGIRGVANQLTSDAPQLDQWIGDVTQTIKSQKEQQALDAARSAATANGQDPNNVYLNTSGTALPTAPTAPVESSALKSWLDGTGAPASGPTIGYGSSVADVQAARDAETKAKEWDAGGQKALDDYNSQVANYNQSVGQYGKDVDAWKAKNRQTAEAATSATPGDVAGRQATLDSKTDPAQQSAALDKMFGGTQGYTQGGGSLDAYLLNADKGAAKQLADYRSKYGGIYSQIQNGTLPVNAPGVVTVGQGPATLEPEKKKTKPTNGWQSTGPGGGGGTSAGF